MTTQSAFTGQFCHSPIHTHIHTVHLASAVRGNLWLSILPNDTGIKPLTLWLVEHPLYPLSHIIHVMELSKNADAYGHIMCQIGWALNDLCGHTVFLFVSLPVMENL